MMKYYIGVCFSPKKHRLFSDIVKDGDNFGIETKRFCTSDNNNDVIKLNFQRKICNQNITAIEQVINKCAIFDIVYPTDFIYNLQPQVMFGIVHHIIGWKIRSCVTQTSD